MSSFTSLIGRIALVGVIALSMLGAVFSAQPSGSAQAAPPLTADYVPADAVLYIAIDTVLLSPQWIQTIALAQRISDGVDPAAVAGNLLEGAFQTDVNIDPVPFLGGEIGLVFIGAGSLIDNADPAETVLDPAASADAVIDGLVIVAMPPSVEAAQVELTRALELAAADRGVEIENAQYRDTSIQFIPGDVANGLPGVAIAQAGDAMMVAASPEQLEPIIDRADGLGESIADIEGFDTASAAMPEERIAFGILNGPSFVADSVTLEGLGVAVEAIVPGGANGVTAFAVSSESDGLRVDTRTVSSNGEPIRTFGDHVDTNLIEQLPAETQIAVSGSDFANTRLVDAALSIVFSILSSSFVSTSDQADSGATPEALPTGLDDSAAGAYALASAFLGVDLQSNLVDLLDGEFLFGLWNTGGQYSDPSFGFISESSDAATIDRTISTLTLAVTLLFGASTSTSPSGAIVIDLDGGSVEIDVIDDSLVIGYGGGGETLLETPESGLVDTELFQSVTEPLPADRSLLVFVNVQALQDGAPPPRVPGPFGLSRSSADGPAFAFVMFNDGDEMGGQGYLYIPEP